MHLHILGICGTFMGGIALLARALGHRVTGSDANVYPPMSTQLEVAGITLMEGYAPQHLQPEPDVVVVGNAMSRGNPAVEYMLERGLRYTSGPQWLAENVLQGRWVLAVAGTHGKTSTASLLAWLLEYANLEPGYLIGGVPENFGRSARLGKAPFFVVEADEYDTAFFDKRSKFVHYRPRTLVLNNLEFDHADIFDDLAQIQRQFHHLLRTVPGNGLVITPAQDANLAAVLEQGCWTPLESFDAEREATWQAASASADGSRFELICEGKPAGRVEWGLLGRHNINNALAAIAAARHAGVPVAVSIEALREFCNVKRRLELIGEVGGVRVYDDFAHHPTAIRTTLEGLRGRVGSQRIIAVLEPRSNTMRRGVHAGELAGALQVADWVLFFRPAELAWDAAAALQPLGDRVALFDSSEAIIEALAETAQPGDHLLIMSNGGFEGLHRRLLERLGRG
ncbi:UDP-N-acetylmuramate:L-alanyl-gamma-D-glutamyl-meso-diaminopimelate ligase [Candidatus Endoriftia persephonae]|jgi:UDP-N-acetylmuramate: L-alanyl-gamma-D-glutamyl-meso-diaminopimelate ligase|uniref:UDP-N-acetylmuramate--L-alanyl-gamma-D-glutamyl-meso-2,6-diaminoheptandioate ligase n=2 Tax=Gammaproteobacteria TaxID=1236 RepID=G2FGV8_9GAMM|nr:UDP-N-acetylmuramate:L-alanyl-gamma-D-glutamyl-meso-diaminopimelate ligase [Candidatus Endoriftia persephone]EGW53927.1 UDP-N-acetylmuramate:L-alanyl-gamma-D-glutamyl-meso-diaminopimelate ligase [endosymbiont of Tevnia jerichonana (vent Tica)]USF87357.1 UDP-N-acetylmuramate:L-alanyl-gamma-D-glutamyl-meso-diaminopimelate ligase [Candidatus Endoriftia persephone]